MKKLKKKVVIGTSIGLASMVLNAGCAYGPPVEYEPETVYSEEATIQQSSESDNDSSVWTEEGTEEVDLDDGDSELPPIEDIEAVYGPPVSGK